MERMIPWNFPQTKTQASDQEGEKMKARILRSANDQASKREMGQEGVGLGV